MPEQRGEGGEGQVPGAQQSARPEAQAGGQHRDEREEWFRRELRRFGEHAPDVRDRDQPEHRGRREQVGFHESRSVGVIAKLPDGK